MEILVLLSIIWGVGGVAFSLGVGSLCCLSRSIVRTPKEPMPFLHPTSKVGWLSVIAASLGVMLAQVCAVAPCGIGPPCGSQAPGAVLFGLYPLIDSVTMLTGALLSRLPAFFGATLSMVGNACLLITCTCVLLVPGVNDRVPIVAGVGLSLMLLESYMVFAARLSEAGLSRPMKACLVSGYAAGVSLGVALSTALPGSMFGRVTFNLYGNGAVLGVSMWVWIFMWASSSLSNISPHVPPNYPSAHRRHTADGTYLQRLINLTVATVVGIPAALVTYGQVQWEVPICSSPDWMSVVLGCICGVGGILLLALTLWLGPRVPYAGMATASSILFATVIGLQSGTAEVRIMAAKAASVIGPVLLVCVSLLRVPSFMADATCSPRNEVVLSSVSSVIAAGVASVGPWVNVRSWSSWLHIISGLCGAFAWAICGSISFDR